MRYELLGIVSGKIPSTDDLYLFVAHRQVRWNKYLIFSLLLKLNPVEAKTTKSNESDNFLPVAREADLSTGPT